MSTEPFEPPEVEINPAPAEGDGYYQSKLRQWVALCPHMGPSERTVLDILTSLTTQVSNRRKLSLDELRQMVFTNPVALGEEPTPISPSGLLRLLRKLSQLGQITADEDGTEIKFSSRKNAQHRPITMTIWRLPRHECGGSRNVFDALDVVRGEDPRFEQARSEQSGARRRPGGAGRKSDPEQPPGSESNPWGQQSNPPSQQSNPGGSESNPDVQGDQQGQRPPITPPITLSDTPSSSSAEVEDITNQVAPSAEKKTKIETSSEIIKRRLTEEHCTTTEADELARIIDTAGTPTGDRIQSLPTWVTRRDINTLRGDLAQLRRFAASPPIDGVCSEHDVSLAPGRCSSCEGDMNTRDFEVVRRILERDGAKKRPDLARRLGAPKPRPVSGSWSVAPREEFEAMADMSQEELRDKLFGPAK